MEITANYKHNYKLQQAKDNSYPIRNLKSIINALILSTILTFPDALFQSLNYFYFSINKT